MHDDLARAFPRLRFRALEPLWRQTTFLIGGPADVFVEVDEEEPLLDLLACLSERRVEHVVLGGGSNLLVDSAGLAAVVVRNNVSWIRLVEEGVEASGGYGLQELLDFALDHQLEGLEFASGIPGSFGGGIAGNAGAYGANLGELLVSARVRTRDGAIRTVSDDYFEFSYRRSRLQRTAEILLSATLKLRRSTDISAARRRRQEILALRAAKHPPSGLPSAGSFFKNLDRFDEDGKRIPAGRLLDQVGCKGLRVGNAQVFECHANIVVNRGGATSAEVLELTAEMKRRILDAFGIELEPEVRYLARHREA